MTDHRAYRFVTSDEMVVEELPWGPHDWLARPGLTESEHLSLVRVHIPKGQGHAFHTHPEMEEIIYVVSGRAEQWVEKERRVLGPGEIAHIPMGLVHATFNGGSEPLVFLAILSPSRTEGPALVDVSSDEPWRTIRSDAVHPEPGGQEHE